MGVLGHEKIEERFDDIFIEGDRSNIDAAKYYLTVGEQFLILPGETAQSQPQRARFVIAPGQTAFLASAERVVMPNDLIGLIGPRYENAEQGILFFGGMLVDPGYGLPAYDSDEPFGQPLTFAIANLGSASLEFRPGEDKIASLAFLEVVAPLTNHELREEFVKSNLVESRMRRHEDEKSDQVPEPLGLVEDLSQIRHEVDELQASATQIILFGVVVLSVTLCAALTTTIFDLTGKFDGSKVVSGGEPIWQIVGLTLGCVVAAILSVVGIFYLCVRAFARGRGRQRKRRLPE